MNAASSHRTIGIGSHGHVGDAGVRMRLVARGPDQKGSSVIVWRSNWIILSQALRSGLVVGAVIAIGATVLTYAGVIETSPLAMLVLFWTIQTSTAYALKRDRIDGVTGVVVMGLLVASLFGGLAAVLLIATGRAPIPLAPGTAAFSLALTWGASLARRFTDRHRP